MEKYNDKENNIQSKTMTETDSLLASEDLLKAGAFDLEQMREQLERLETEARQANDSDWPLDSPGDEAEDVVDNQVLLVCSVLPLPWHLPRLVGIEGCFGNVHL